MSTESIVLVWSIKYVITTSFVQLIRSTTRRHFRGRKHGPAWKCIYPKRKPIKKNSRNHGNLTKRTSELHERAINCKKRSHWLWFLRRMKERL